MAKSYCPLSGGVQEHDLPPNQGHVVRHRLSRPHESLAHDEVLKLEVEIGSGSIKSGLGGIRTHDLRFRRPESCPG